MCTIAGLLDPYKIARDNTLYQVVDLDRVMLVRQRWQGGEQITINALTAKRDAVLLRWTARSSTPPGALMGLLVSRCAGGQIAESWTQWNQAGVLEHLGLIQRTGPPGKVSTTASSGDRSRDPR